jgi:hypothetical protein
MKLTIRPSFYTYFDPETVTTTISLPGFPSMREVVTSSPSSNAGDPVISPVMDPSLF